jgi:hypothetical protein
LIGSPQVHCGMGWFLMGVLVSHLLQ